MNPQYKAKKNENGSFMLFAPQEITDFDGTITTHWLPVDGKDAIDLPSLLNRNNDLNANIENEQNEVKDNEAIIAVCQALQDNSVPA